MTSYNKRHKKQNLQEASTLMSYNRVKEKSQLQDSNLWETIENLYVGTLLTEERINEQKALFDWVRKLGKNALGSIKKFTSSLSSGEQKMAQDLSQELGGTQQGSEIKSLLKKGNWGEALQKGLDTINKYFSSGQLAEGLQKDGDTWRNMKVWKKVVLTLGFLVIMFAQASPGEKIDQDQVNQASIEYSMDGEQTSDINSYDKIFDDNTEKPIDLKFGDQSIQNAGFETGVSFELGSSNLDAQGQQQIDDIANDYLNQIESAQGNGDSVESLDITVQGGASNTGDGWDNDNDYDGSLTENRESETGNKLKQSIKTQAQQRGIDLSGIDINYNMSGGMDVSDLGGDENVKDGQKTSTQNTLINGNLTHTPPAQDAPTGGVDIDLKQTGPMAKFNVDGEKSKDKKEFRPGIARGSRNLELRDLLYLGGIIAPATFGDYKTDAEMGRVDWRDIDVSGDKDLEDMQKLAVWVTNTRKSKFPLLKRTQNALQGIIDIEFDDTKKYKGNVGTKFEPSTTTAITEEENKLPPEVIKQPEIPQQVKGLQGNITSMWKFILGTKAIGDIVKSEEASEFDSNMKEFLEQLDLMYGESGTRGNVKFRYRRNPNYTGSKYKNISDKWNKKITGGVEDFQFTGGEEEVLPFKQDYTGDYIQGIDGNPLIGSANSEELQEEIKRIKKLLL